MHVGRWYGKKNRVYRWREKGYRGEGWLCSGSVSDMDGENMGRVFGWEVGRGYDGWDVEKWDEVMK